MMENNVKEKIRQKRGKANKRFLYYSVITMSLSIVIALIGTFNRITTVGVVKEFYDNGDWATDFYGIKLVLMSDKSFMLYHCQMEIGYPNFYGTWDLKGDTLVLNGRCKKYNFIGFNNARYKVYSDSISLIGNQNCIFKHFLTYDKYWYNNLVREDGSVIRGMGR